MVFGKLIVIDNGMVSRFHAGNIRHSLTDYSYSRLKFNSFSIKSISGNSIS